MRHFGRTRQCLLLFFKRQCCRSSNLTNGQSACVPAGSSLLARLANAETEFQNCVPVIKISSAESQQRISIFPLTFKMSERKKKIHVSLRGSVEPLGVTASRRKEGENSTVSLRDTGPSVSVWTLAGSSSLSLGD